MTSEQEKCYMPDDNLAYQTRPASTPHSSLSRRLDCIEKELDQRISELSARVRELEHDRDALVEREIQRRLLKSSTKGDVYQCNLAEGRGY